MANAPGKISNLQITMTDDLQHSNLTTKNHIINKIGGDNPQKLGAFISQGLYNLKGYTGLQLVNILKSENALTESIIEDGVDSVTWELMMQKGYFNEVVKNLDPSNEKPGYRHSTFKIALKRNHFSIGDVIVYDQQDALQLYIINKEMGADFTVYTVHLVTKNPESFVPKEKIDVGARYWRAFHPIGERSNGSSLITMDRGVMMKNYATELRIDHEVTRKAITAAHKKGEKTFVQFTIIGENGQKDHAFCRAIELELFRQMNEDLDFLLVHGQMSVDPKTGKTHLNDGSSPIKIGSGLREQIAASNKMYLKRPKISMPLLMDFLSNLANKVDSLNFENVEFILATGRQGRLMFSEAVKAYDAGNSLNTIENSNRIRSGSGIKQEFLGFEYDRATLPNGIKVRVVLMPFYDRTDRNSAYDTINGVPKESYRMTFLNFNRNSKGHHNIQLITNKTKKILWYTQGSVNPMGVTRDSFNQMSSNSTDGYGLHYIANGGIVILDPTACGEIILQ